jgi:hypothetical protein
MNISQQALNKTAEAVLYGAGCHVLTKIRPLPKCEFAYRYESPLYSSFNVEDVSVQVDEGGGLCAIADRYGGAGIGRNGGSGRNIVFGGLQIKGVGRTELVGNSVPLSHASGGAYFEECVRETIFSRVLDHDFPHGAVPTLALVDTAMDIRWPEPIYPPLERQVLMVRPLFARPAHFERAIGFISSDPRVGCVDTFRVMQSFVNANSVLGCDGLLKMFMECFIKIIHQVVYGYVHRIWHGSITSSNISIDGRLLDFGATSAVTAWRRYATADGFVGLDDMWASIVRAVRSVSYYVKRYTHQDISGAVDEERFLRRLHGLFVLLVRFEVLRIFGFDDEIAEDIVCGRSGAKVGDLIDGFIRSEQSVYVDLRQPDSFNAKDLSILSLWKPAERDYAVSIRCALRAMLSNERFEEAFIRSEKFLIPRPQLHKATLRRDIFEMFARVSVSGVEADINSVTAYINNVVSENLRESRSLRGTPARIINTSLLS